MANIVGFRVRVSGGDDDTIVGCVSREFVQKKIQSKSVQGLVYQMNTEKKTGGVLFLGEKNPRYNFSFKPSRTTSGGRDTGGRPRTKMDDSDDDDSDDDAKRLSHLKKAFERACASSRPIPTPEDETDVAAVKEREDVEGVEKMSELARKLADSSNQSLSKTLLKRRRNRCLFAIVDMHFKRNEYRAALNACKRICTINSDDKPTEHLARTTAFGILVAAGDVEKARRMLATIDETIVGAHAMIINRVLLCTANGAYDDALRLLTGSNSSSSSTNEGVDTSCAKRMCECVLLFLKTKPKLALKCMLDAMSNNPQRYLSKEDVGLVALINTCACYDISSSDASAKMAFFRFAKANCTNETVGNFILNKQQQRKRMNQQI